MLKIHYLIVVVTLAMLPLEFGCAQQPSHGCKEVEINSAGVYCFDTSRLLGIAPGAGGIGGVADYVRISPPVISDENFDDVSKIVVMADVNPATEPRCHVAKDASLSCAMSVAGKMLNAIVTFRSTTAGRAKERTRIVATDVSQNVIKQWRR